MRRACIGAVLLLSLLLLGCAQPERLTAPTDRGTFYLTGEVARPGAYSLCGRSITVRMAVSAGGALGEWAEVAVLVRDLDRPDQRLIDLDLYRVFQQEASNLILQDGDVLVLGCRSDAMKLNYVREQLMSFSGDSRTSGTAPKSEQSSSK